MAESSIWWVAAGIAVALELATATFYLLMIAFGMAVGAIAAHLGAGTSLQMVLAAAAGGASVLVLHYSRKSLIKPIRAEANRDVNMDIGGLVQVDAWAADGTAQVQYRGAAWTVVPQNAALANAGVANSRVLGQHRIVEVSGNHLLVEKV